jgi:hypothetical protein
MLLENLLLSSDCPFLSLWTGDRHAQAASAGQMGGRIETTYRRLPGASPKGNAVWQRERADSHEPAVCATHLEIVEKRRSWAL